MNDKDIIGALDWLPPTASEARSPFEQLKEKVANYMDESKLRDEFAMSALQMLSFDDGDNYAYHAEIAYGIADAMLEERKKKQVKENESRGENVK